MSMTDNHNHSFVEKKTGGKETFFCDKCSKVITKGKATNPKAFGNVKMRKYIVKKVKIKGGK